MSGNPVRLDSAAPEQIPWSDVGRTLTESKTYWLATVRPDGRPHVAPLWCVWSNDRLYFSTGGASRKAKNLAHRAHCTISVQADDLHLSIEGEVARVTDLEELEQMAEVYSAKYGWRMAARNGEFQDDYGHGGPVFALSPAKVLAFRPEATGLKTERWRY